jgi:hypothetical protein
MNNPSRKIFAKKTKFFGTIAYRSDAANKEKNSPQISPVKRALRPRFTRAGRIDTDFI